MIYSMTGFGRARETVDGLDITAEIKSVNNRYFDCSAKISRGYTYAEEPIKPFLQSLGITRGKVDVTLTVEADASRSPSVSLDEGYLTGYLTALERLHTEFGLADDRSVMSVARNPEIFTVQKPEEDLEHDRACILSVLKKAAEAFLASRAAEGERLGADIRSKLDSLENKVARVKELSLEDVSSYRERLATRIREALSDNQITPDETRLLTECAIHADKVAVDEELVRLKAHFEAFRTILDEGGSVGRKLDFLVQEMNREVNTTGSKCNDAAIAHIVVDAKCELEKIREQIQNLE